MTVRLRRMTGWLLLTFTLPTKRASQRVEVWRKLQRYGTVPLGNSGYLLPKDASNEERFEWLATAIRKYGGDASVVHVQSIDNLSSSQLIGRFSDQRAKEYQELVRQLKKSTPGLSDRKGTARLVRLRSRFQEIVDVDFFESPLQKRVAELLANAEERTDGQPKVSPRIVDPREFKNRLWVTRPRPGVDRSASAWLIRRFIDAKARFAFALEERVPKDAIPFDMFQSGGFGHRGDDCTFETL